MRFERGASNTFTIAARPTLTPSKWLLKFVKVDGGLTILCIAQATPEEGDPVQMTFTEQDATPNPLIGQVTLPIGQWQLTVYEQSSTTNLNWTLSDRSPFTALVEVVGAYVPPPPPTDPCGDVCDDATVEINGVEVETVEAGDTVDIPVLQNGSPVGSWNGTQWIIPTCPSGSTGNYWRAISLGT